jgi:hypothetical protein
MSGGREMCHLARYKSVEKNSEFTKVLVTSFPLLVWLRCLSFVLNCHLARQWASDFRSKEFSLIDAVRVTHYRPWRVIIIIIKVLTTHVFCRPVIVGSVYVMSTVVPQFLVPHGFYFCFLWTWQTRLFCCCPKCCSMLISRCWGVLHGAVSERSAASMFRVYSVCM